MKVRPFSDIHLEFGDYRIPEMEDDKNTVLVLAGDITVASDYNRMMFRFKPFIEDCCDRFRHVIMVMGNHEHYNGVFHKSDEVIVHYTNHLANFTLLNNESIQLDNVCFIGATLWTDCGSESTASPMAVMHWSGMSDSQVIAYMEYPAFPLHCVREEHERARSYVYRKLKGAKSLGYKAVLITHHAPSLQSIGDEYKTHSLNKFFASDMVLNLVDAGVDLCIHGHMHDAKNYDLASGISNAKVVCNPRGYHGYESKPEARGFNDKLILEI
jgi:predicted phosphodiesterase